MYIIINGKRILLNRGIYIRSTVRCPCPLSILKTIYPSKIKENGKVPIYHDNTRVYDRIPSGHTMPSRPLVPLSPDSHHRSPDSASAHHRPGPRYHIVRHLSMPSPTTLPSPAASHPETPASTQTAKAKPISRPVLLSHRSRVHARRISWLRSPFLFV